MSDECKKITELAKEVVNSDPVKAIDLYMQAAQCFASTNEMKSSNSNLEKAAKLLQFTAKTKDDPLEALTFYEESSSIYAEIGLNNQGQKILNEGHQKLVNAAKTLKSEGKKMEDPKHAEAKFTQASEYALKGNDEILSYECWRDLGDQFRLHASNIQDPQSASQFYKLAILNYKKGHDQKKEMDALTDLGDKFNQKAEDLYSQKKDLIFAFDNYLQANTIYSHATSEKKAKASSLKVQEIVDTIGIPKKLLVEFLIRNEVNPSSLFNNTKNTSVSESREFDKFGFEDYDNYDIVEPKIRKNIITAEIPQPTLASTVISSFSNTSNLENNLRNEIINVEHTNVNPDQHSTVKHYIEKITDQTRSARIEIQNDNAFLEIPDDASPKNAVPSPIISDFDIPSIPHKVNIESPTTPSVVSSQAGASDINVSLLNEIPSTISERSNNLVITEEVVDILRKQGYVSQNLTEMQDLLQIPEYQILSLIINQHPISLDHLEEITKLDSLSLVLSNLKADDLIVQTNDYQWTVSEKIEILY